MYELIVQTWFSAAHRLREYQGNCEKLHGHNWKLDVRLRSDRLDSLGMVMDFRELKRLLKDVVDRLDHQYLNDVPPFTGVNPTTENVARFVYDELAKTLPGGLKPASVTAWESQNCGATYSG
jgi:6-pyruvoyltetrahydropterin/6-carboxytetrahydropterin synthase